jgi:primosomal protein N' (replication factor Y)
VAGAAGQQAATRPARRGASRDPGPAASVLPVARVAVDIPLAHLDRPFDYLIPERLSGQAVPGCRVRVRFAGQLVDGYLLDRAAESSHQGRLARLERVVSPEPVLSPEIMALAREVADRCAGTLADVLRLAIPPRHARTETAAVPPAAEGADRPAGPPGPGPWARYPDGPAFLGALASSRGPRAVWSALPGPHWPEEIARAVASVAAAGRGALAVVPDARDLSLLDPAGTSRCPRTSGPPSATGAGWPSAAAGSGWWPAPAPPCSRRSATWDWWFSGMTATTCTPSPAHRTRTPARCSRCGRTAPARPS